MYLGLTERERARAERHDVRRVVEPAEIENAFHEAHQLARTNPSFLRSLGWYRKGLTTDDPLDKFLAFWNAIEIVASKYYHYVPAIDKQRAKNGSKSQVWECFKVLWGPCDKWPVIPGQTKWIDESHSIRLDVAHGVAFVDIHKVAEVADRLPAIEEFATTSSAAGVTVSLTWSALPPTNPCPRWARIRCPSERCATKPSAHSDWRATAETADPTASSP